MKKNISLSLAAISLGLSLSGPVLFAQEKKTQIDQTTIKEVIHSIDTIIQRNYVYPDKGALIVKFLNNQYKKGKYKNLTDPVQLTDKITTDILSVQNDKHLRIEYNPQLEKDIIKFNSSISDKDKITELDIAKEKSQNFYFKKLEILPSNIGYMEFTNFALSSNEARKIIQSAMQFLSNTDALIIDLRNNRGGSGASNNILGYFFDHRTKTGRTFNRIQNTWTDSFVESPENGENLRMKMPVYILVSKKTFSAAEGFAYTLLTLRNAKVVGNSTSGGAHLTRSFSLGNGFVGFIPYLRHENEKTHTDWEGTGVVPDILSDSPLLTAQNEILKDKLKTANNQEKSKIQWLIHYNESQIADIKIDSSQMEKYTGRFAEFEITKQDSQLYFRDVNQNSKVPFPMIAISQTLFQIGGDYQIEFINLSNDKFQAVNMSWSDGWSEKIDRTP
ncbi:S41 family peptidase [Chryseobacterium angstadtii]|uniref:S41 family peptidase n=1 Tax=Chryseobacterium angstadtii TaxID=558151 RepID=UPI00065A934C|nr:S41 family peptidase [Chryseobacterium angstadtii]